MYDSQTRINAMITYLFLWPFFLLAKKGTPFAHPFVRAHAKHASLIMGIGWFAFLIYFYFLRDILRIGIFGFSVGQIILMLIVTTLIVLLILGGYRAFRWGDPGKWLQMTSVTGLERESWIYSEEEKVRITASFLPFIGIFLAQKYPQIEILIGRKVGNFFTFCIILSTVFFGGVNTTGFLLTILYIIVIAMTGVYLFFQSEFLTLSFYAWIPSYHAIEAHIKTTLLMTREFVRVAFGGEKKFTYQEKYTFYLTQVSQVIPRSAPYWTHHGIFAIPGVNLITIPSFLNEKYDSYRGLIAEGILLTLFVCSILFFFAGSNALLYLLLFPIVTLIAEGKNNVHVRAPFTSLAWELIGTFLRTKKTVDDLKNQSQSESFRYQVDGESINAKDWQPPIHP